MINNSMKPKVVVISANTCWYILNFRENTIKSLISLGYRVICVAPKDEFSEKLLELNSDFIHVNIERGGTNPIKDMMSILALIRIYKKVKPNIVLNFTPKNNIYSTIAAKACGAKVINNIAGLGLLFVRESFSSRVARALYRLTQPFADHVFFQNVDDKALFIERKICKSNQVSVLPGSGVDLVRFNFTPSKRDSMTRFILVARLIYEKGVREYVDAASEMKKLFSDEVEFNILGFIDSDNPSAVKEHDLQRWVNEGTVKYLGSTDKIENEVGLVDCVVLPSYYREGVPKSLLEAAAMGKPIITTNSVGCKEVVDDGINGFLCEPRNWNSLKNAMEKIHLMTHDERENLGANGRNKVINEFDERIVIEKYIAVINELCP